MTDGLLIDGCAGERRLSRLTHLRGLADLALGDFRSLENTLHVGRTEEGLFVLLGAADLEGTRLTSNRV